MVKMEKILVTWMDHRKCQALNVTFDDTKNKAMQMECFNYLKEETVPMPDFVASTGYIFHSIKRLGEAKSTDEDAAATYPDRLKAIMDWGGGGRLQAPVVLQYG